MNNPNAYLDEIIKKIQITKERQKHIKNAVQSIYNNLKTVLPQCDNYRFGGGFKRYTSIKNYFDVDVYFIGKYPKQNLLSYFTKKLKKLEATYKPFRIARPPPYLHAIPAIFNKDVELDCLAAIDLGDGIYLIPEGSQIIKIKPSLDEKKLKELNRNTSGLGTKIIRLLKLWNALRKKPFKSYQLESLAFKIFKSKQLNKLDKCLITYFRNCITFLKNGNKIYDEIDNHQILKGLNRTKAISLMQQTINLIKNDKWTKVFPTI